MLGVSQLCVVMVFPGHAHLLVATWSRGYKTLFMLNSAEHEIYPAHKC